MRGKRAEEGEEGAWVSGRLTAQSQSLAADCRSRPYALEERRRYLQVPSLISWRFNPWGVNPTLLGCASAPQQVSQQSHGSPPTGMPRGRSEGCLEQKVKGLWNCALLKAPGSFRKCLLVQSSGRRS